MLANKSEKKFKLNRVGSVNNSPEKSQNNNQLISENITNKNCKFMICDEIELDYIKNFLLPIPNFIKTMLNYCQIDEDYIEKHLDYENLRWELLITFYYLIYSDINTGGLQNLPKKESILSVIDQRLQGKK